MGATGHCSELFPCLLDFVADADFLMIDSSTALAPLVREDSA